jgi:hypothetical protein
METFKASVQYGDWHGTAAADDVDPMATSLDRYLEEKGLIKPGEFLLAATLWVGENSDNKIDNVFVKVFLLEGHQSVQEVEKTLRELRAEPVPVRKVSLELTLEQFVAMFKRFAVTLTYGKLPLENREFVPTEE